MAAKSKKNSHPGINSVPLHRVKGQGMAASLSEAPGPGEPDGRELNTRRPELCATSSLHLLKRDLKALMPVRGANSAVLGCVLQMRACSQGETRARRRERKHARAQGLAQSFNDTMDTFVLVRGGTVLVTFAAFTHNAVL